MTQPVTPVKKPGRTPPPPPPGGRFNRLMFIWAMVGLALIYMYNMVGQRGWVEQAPKELRYSQYYQMLLTNRIDKDSPKVLTAELIEDRVQGKLADGSAYMVIIPPGDQDMLRALRENVEDFRLRRIRTLWTNLFFNFAPPLMFIGLLWLLIYRGGQQGGGRIWSFGRSHARQHAQGQIQATFRDVAGVDEAKEELQEIIEFLRDPKKYQRLGGKIPKGVLLMGPPGCGKTLLAKAVAGEAGVPFFSISGSDFVEMFVGVGASRVRDLFEQGKRAAKASGKGAILFIDEIDAVGRMRFAGIGGGHDEREQTLNALLVEMDGFNTQEGVILIAASNRPDVLDPALVRPGRFDRQVVIDRPDLNGREEILKVHVRHVKIAPRVNLREIAQQTPGFSGADLANLVNEAALLAARRNKEAVTKEELEDSIEKVIAGPERHSRIISKEEKRIVAHHEAGHALIAHMLPGADPVHKISIIPRGTAALGYTMQRPLEDRHLVSRQELLDKITVLLGGRVSEALIFTEITTGAQNDLEIATELAHKMVCEFGMSERLGHLTFGKKEHAVFLGRDMMQDRNFSESTAVIIDQEVRKIVDACHARAQQLLREHMAELKTLAERLLEKEVLENEEVEAILGAKRVNGPHAHEPQSPSGPISP